MGKVRVVTDSNAYLSPEFLAQHQVEIIPHRIKIGSSVYEEGSDFSADQMFARLNAAQAAGMNHVPEVLAADINTILDIFQTPGSEAEHIVSIHMSSKLSPMYAQARRAAEMLRGRYTIRVIDSQSTSFGLGQLVERAALAAERGGTAHDIARVVNGAVPHLYVAVFAESLSYLERSAQLGASQSLLGTMLGIKAMIMMEEGKLATLEKVQTREEVVDKLFEFVSEFARVERVGIFHHNYEKHRVALVERLREQLGLTASCEPTYSPSLAAYLGPNMIGVVVQEGAF
jgi:DegV family protein with EDD domain